jgi:hypothetical protein
MGTKLQQAEFNLWCRAVLDAARLACAGDKAAGYECLLSGLYRALDHQRAGEPWAARLAQQYRRVIVLYCRHHPAPGRLATTVRPSSLPQEPARR